MSIPGKDNQTVVNKVLRYLRGTTKYAINCQGKPENDRELNVHGFFNADWAGDMD